MSVFDIYGKCGIISTNSCLYKYSKIFSVVMTRQKIENAINYDKPCSTTQFTVAL